MGSPGTGTDASRPAAGGAKHAQPMFVYAGPDTKHLVPSTVNDPAAPMDVENENFVGRVLIRIKDYGGHKGALRTPEVSFVGPPRR